MNCQRSGCGGTIQDGYCDTCGRAPVGAAPAAGITTSAKVGGAVSARASASLSGRGSFGTAGSGRTGSSGSRRGSRGTTRRSLGAGLINLEPLPTIDPLQSLLADP
ncbi:MAG: serine/threonine protein kinase, partial [Fibrella sp.]|nr:serine/threonine protein kinase [Armatimonadota bacterium]